MGFQGEFFCHGIGRLIMIIVVVWILFHLEHDSFSSCC
jgi:hypothetical protein